jgi:uncharacterized protein (UPF0332 family)
MPDRPHESLQRARQALTTARVDHETADDSRAALNRLYYACFHAARAVLYDRGHETIKHRGVLSLVDRELVHEGTLPRKQSQTLRDLFVARQDADYGFGPVSADVERLMTQAEEFVEVMADLLNEDEDTT